MFQTPIQVLPLKWIVLSHPITTVQNIYTTTIKRMIVRKLRSRFLLKSFSYSKFFLKKIK